MLASIGKRNVMGVGLGILLLAGCSADADETFDVAQQSDELRKRHGRRGHDYRGPRPHPRHRHGCGGEGGAGGSSGSTGKGGTTSQGGSGGMAGMGGRGSMGGRSTGGTAGTGGGIPACTPVGAMLIDNFEDGDTVTSSIPIGEWFSVNDETAGAVQTPNPWVPTPGGADGSAFAACTAGSGFLNWGALIGMVFPSETPNVLACIDASSVNGIRFKARGSGLVRLNATTRATTSVEFGGTCTGGAGFCDYSPNYVIPISPDWQTFEVPWGAIQPGNLPFDPTDMLGMHFAAFDEQFPAGEPISFDFCVDDIELY